MNKHIRLAIQEGMPLIWEYGKGEFLLMRRTALHENGSTTTRVCYRTTDIARLLALSEKLMAAGKPCDVSVLNDSYRNINIWAHGWKPEFSKRLDAVDAFGK